MIRIIDYRAKYQPDIDEMMHGISLEFPDDISANPPLRAPVLPDAYWVALHDGSVVGTVGASKEDGYAVLKRMMVKKEFRGEAMGVSKKLLETALHWSLSAGLFTIYLGTMAQFKAAQNFYAKHGFTQIPERELPRDFVKNPVDSLFFRLDYEAAVSVG